MLRGRGWMSEKKASGYFQDTEKSLLFKTSWITSLNSILLQEVSRAFAEHPGQRLALGAETLFCCAPVQGVKTNSKHAPKSRPPLSPRVCSPGVWGGPHCRETGGIVPVSKIRPPPPPTALTLTLLSPSQGLSSTLSPGGHQGGESSIHLPSQGRGSCSPQDPRSQRLQALLRSYFQASPLSNS